jgi:hypothetical protein
MTNKIRHNIGEKLNLSDNRRCCMGANLRWLSNNFRIPLNSCRRDVSSLLNIKNINLKIKNIVGIKYVIQQEPLNVIILDQAITDNIIRTDCMIKRL